MAERQAPTWVGLAAPVVKRSGYYPTRFGFTSGFFARAATAAGCAPASVDGASGVGFSLLSFRSIPANAHADLCHAFSRLSLLLNSKHPRNGQGRTKPCRFSR